MGSSLKLRAITSVAALGAGFVGLGVAGANLLGIQSGAYAASPESYSSVNWTGLLSMLPTGAGIWGLVSTFLKSQEGKDIVDKVVDLAKNKTEVKPGGVVSLFEETARKLVEANGTDAGDIPETAALTTLWATRTAKGDDVGAKLVTDLATHIRQTSKTGVRK